MTRAWSRTKAMVDRVSRKAHRGRLPETADEVIRTVRCCFESSVPFVARGNGTSLSGGSLPVKNGIVISMNRMNRILRLDPVERLAVVEPGVINLNVTKAAAPLRTFVCPRPIEPNGLHDRRQRCFQ